MSQETYHQHETQKEKHVEDHIGDEIRKVKEQEEREAHGFLAGSVRSSDMSMRLILS